MNGLFTLGMTIGGMSISGSRIARAYDSGEGYGPWAIAAAKAGSLTTRTDDDTGIITFAAAHGYTGNELLDIYWVDGLRYWTKVTAVDGLTATIDDPGGLESGGDNLPTEGTAVLACERTVKAVSFDGDDMSQIGLWMKKRGHFEFLDVGDASLWAQELKANEALPWVDTWPYTRPITGNAVTQVRYSNGEAAASEFRFGVLLGSAL